MGGRRFNEILDSVRRDGGIVSNALLLIDDAIDNDLIAKPVDVRFSYYANQYLIPFSTLIYIKQHEPERDPLLHAFARSFFYLVENARRAGLTIPWTEYDKAPLCDKVFYYYGIEIYERNRHMTLSEQQDIRDKALKLGFNSCWVDIDELKDKRIPLTDGDAQNTNLNCIQESYGNDMSTKKSKGRPPGKFRGFGPLATAKS